MFCAMRAAAPRIGCRSPWIAGASVAAAAGDAAGGTGRGAG